MVEALIDGDILAYRNAISAEGDPVEIALLRTEEHLAEILKAVNTEKFRIFISGKNNFRYDINPFYKSDRTTPEPIHLNACKEFLILQYGATVTDGYEADDALAINQTEETVICSIDKDLLQIPGKHYSWPIFRKGEVIREEFFSDVSELEGLKNFYKQMLIGDISDSIIGVKGIGKVKASKLIDPLETEKDMFNVVYPLYNDIDRFWMNADCVWLLRKENIIFSDRRQ